MQTNGMEEILEELHLLLIYLTGWEEESISIPGTTVYKSWKEYLHEVINKLEENKWIIYPGCKKLLIVTDEGKQKAQELMEKYLKPNA